MTKTPFATALDNVANSGLALDQADLAGLSNARRGDVTLFAQRWPTITVERRRAIMQRFNEIIDESFEVEYTALNRVALADTDPQVRATAISNLWESDDEALIDPYLKFLTDDEAAEVRAAAATALGKYMMLAEMEELDETQGGKIRQALLATIRNPTEHLEPRRRAVESIAFLGDEEVRAILEDAYNSPYEEMQQSALFGMGRSLDQYWSGTILLELANSSPTLRLEAVRASGELELRQAIPLLIEMLEDPDRAVLMSAIHSLGQIGGPIARRALDLVAESEDEEIAQEAEDALAELQFASGDDDWLVYDLNRSGADDDDETGLIWDEGGLDLNDPDAFDVLWKNRDREFDD
jgi:HEAT repeat protein